MRVTLGSQGALVSVICIAGGRKIILGGGGGGGTIVGLIVLPLQCILVNTCMHDMPKKWGGGGGTSTCPVLNFVGQYTSARRTVRLLS